MNKPELLKYLKAVCEAEEAKYACEEAISNVKQQMSQVLGTTPPEPVQPEWARFKPRKTNSTSVGDAGGCFLSVFSLIVGFFVFSLLYKCRR